MEGLLIAEQLRRVSTPRARLSWRFPDAHTFVLPLVGGGALWLYNRPPNPMLAYRPDAPPPGGAHSGFQALLVARAGGELAGLEQLKLDRVVRLHFAAAEGFVTTPPVTLVAELTGRNCNLILTDSRGMVMGAAREVGRDINRFRQVRAGVPYQPPPPYDKLDPRGVADSTLTEAVVGKRLKDLRKVIDGFGPDLSAAVAHKAGFDPSHTLGKQDAQTLLVVLKQAVEAPGALKDELGSLQDVATLRRDETRHIRLTQLREVLGKHKRILQKRLSDIDKLREAALGADDLRSQADVLMAFQHQVPPGAREVTLSDFMGDPLLLELDPRQSALQNAQVRYDKAKKREQRAAYAAASEAGLQREMVELEAQLVGLETLTHEQLGALEADYLPKTSEQFRREPGMRFTSPQGYTVLVGRNAKDNDTITFKLARSLDVWLHTQGYRGSHVIVRAEGREVPFETILYAAQLAAAYSQAAASDNVAVDYTLKKHVWRPKGAAPGAVHFSQHKTVFVTPSRRPDG